MGFVVCQVSSHCLEQQAWILEGECVCVIFQTEVWARLSYETTEGQRETIALERSLQQSGGGGTWGKVKRSSMDCLLTFRD